MIIKLLGSYALVENTYLVTTLKHWNIRNFHEVIKLYPGAWHLITEPSELSIENVRNIAPKYIFFPHWSHIVPNSIIENVDCICFHMTDLPFGRGGSPLQNLIKLGCKTTVVSALKMTSALDAGPIYMKRKLSLHGSAEDIYIRASNLISTMIKHIVETEPKPLAQKGKTVVFKRRKPEQSVIDSDIKTLDDLYDHIRMLDADGYPRAFVDVGEFRFEFTDADLSSEKIFSKVKITKRNSKIDD